MASINQALAGLKGGAQRVLEFFFKDILKDLTAIRAPLAGLITGSATVDHPSIAAGSGITANITATGAALGDLVVGISCSVDLQGLTLTGYVSAANTVSYRLQNGTGGAIDLASATFYAVVAPKASFVAPATLKTVA